MSATDLSFSIDVTANTSTADVTLPDVSGLIARRWESGLTDRLNEAHWEPAAPAGEPIDISLAEQLPEMRRRVTHEYKNNSYVEGTIGTHAVDIVGEDGPTLEVISDSDRYSDRAEKFWREWAELCDYTGEEGLPEIMQGWIRSIWREGGFTTQQVTRHPNVDGADFPSQFRIHSVDINRLETPWAESGNPNIAFGIRRDQDGVPLTYFFARPQHHGPYRIATGQFDPLPADLVHHGYIKHWPEQPIGYPLLASALNAIAGIRDYDQHVLDAADQAASHNEWFVNLNPDGAKFMPPDDKGFSVPDRRRVTRAAPPGWDVRFGDANHPTAEYVGHRKERMAEIGRAAAMPLMLIRLDSSGHNYSSARFDREGYVRHVRSWASWLGRRHLTRMAKVLFRELHLAGELPRMPLGTTLRWNFPPPPEVDPIKSRGEEKLGLQNKTLPFAEACRRNHRNEDDVIASWARTFKKLKAAGLSDADIHTFFKSSWAPKAGGGSSAMPNAAKDASESPTGATGVPNGARNN
ncbi:phage portal protein [Roseiconus lacunae]|uniref:Phage portal protein n=1 Tax=Roseiconus lacunae TaxID=2605694 RepID=A0ABT7PI32_9BACT|nr:phage portal protein [Roseiconus lacunae]MDM4015841.1 phage portal protein [Roseiconus lacunae]